MWPTAEGERRIFVAIDEGDESMYALSWCLKNIVAQNSKYTLILLYAKSPRATWTTMEKYVADVADCVMEIPRKTNGWCRKGDPSHVENQLILSACRQKVDTCNEEYHEPNRLGYGCHFVKRYKTTILSSSCQHCVFKSEGKIEKTNRGKKLTNPLLVIE
ncbi:unnamed protein product [Malus baccata var. baccata]